MAKRKINVFLVDDDPVQNQMLTDHLDQFEDFQITSFETGESMLERISEKPDVVFLDYYLDSVVADAQNGIEILKQLKDVSPETEVIMLSGQDKIEVAVETMKHGAFDYVVKNESSFLRSENSLENINKNRRLKQLASSYRKSTIILAVALVVIVITAVVLYVTGVALPNPGWG